MIWKRLGRTICVIFLAATMFAAAEAVHLIAAADPAWIVGQPGLDFAYARSEEHTSELQSPA